MGEIVFFLVLLAGGSLLTIFPALLSIFEKNNGQVAATIHIGINLSFIVFSVYYLLFVPMYPHGPSPAWLLVPAWPAFMFFYGFIYPNILGKDKSIVLSRAIAGIYGLGTMLALINIIRDLMIGK